MKNKTASEKFIDFIKNNQTTVFTTLGLTVAIILLIVFVYTRIQVVNANSSDKLTTDALKDKMATEMGISAKQKNNILRHLALGKNV